MRGLGGSAPVTGLDVLDEQIAMKLDHAAGSWFFKFARVYWRLSGPPHAQDVIRSSLVRQADLTAKFPA